MDNTKTVASTSRGFGRAAARAKVGKGSHVLAAAAAAARALYPALNATHFAAGFAAERRAMRGGR